MCFRSKIIRRNYTVKPSFHPTNVTFDLHPEDVAVNFKVLDPVELTLWEQIGNE